MTVDCPYCREPIQAGARKCKHCGEYLDPKLREVTEARALRTFPHLIHFVLWVVTLGLWTPFWALAFAIRNRKGKIFY